MTGSEPSAPARITVLRLGHRIGRDPRISTHVGLVARAFGAERFLLAGEADKDVLSNLREVSKRFGGEFEATHEDSALGWLRRFTTDAGDGMPGVAVHLTMYGEPHEQAISQIPTDRPLAVVVGGAKVGKEYYEVCQHNVAVGNQPHSEVAALAVFMAAFLGGMPGANQFSGGQLEIRPSSRGKDVVDYSEDE